MRGVDEGIVIAAMFAPKMMVGRSHQVMNARLSATGAIFSNHNFVEYLPHAPTDASSNDKTTIMSHSM
jgi:hypothetical protein